MAKGENLAVTIPKKIDFVLNPFFGELDRRRR